MRREQSRNIRHPCGASAFFEPRAVAARERLGRRMAKIGGIMQVNGNSAAPASQSSSTRRHSERTVWIITGYLASGLALLGVMAYYFSSYVVK